MEQAANTQDQRPPAMADMHALMRRVRAFAEKHEAASAVHNAVPGMEVLTRRFGFAPRGQGRAEVILAQDCAAELGHPATASLAILLCTPQAGLVHHGRVTVIGPDLDAVSPDDPAPFAQVVLLQIDEQQTPDPFALDNAQYLMRRLPGYAVRTVPGKLWARISNLARSSGLSLETVGAALIASYTADFPGVRGVEVLFVTASREHVHALEPVAVEASILSGRHKKLVIGAHGDVECTELNCDTCDEKPVCDNLRDVVIARRGRPGL